MWGGMTEQPIFNGPRQVLFLDFDGVLNNVGWFLTKETIDMFLQPNEVFKANMDPANLRIISYILKELPELKIIISSSWRIHYSIEEIKAAFVNLGHPDIAERVIDRTPKKFSSERCHEVLMSVSDYQLSETPGTNQWATLDDRGIFYSEFREREFQTDKDVGVTIVDAFKIIKFFNPEFLVPVVVL